MKALFLYLVPRPAHDASKEVVWARGILKDIGCKQVKPTVLYCDNKAAKHLISNLVLHRSAHRIVHIDVKFHYVREVVESERMIVTHVASELQRADLLTKPLAK